VTRIAILASGRGSNAASILEYFKDHPVIQVALIGSNNPEPGVRLHAEAYKVPFAHFSADERRAVDPVLDVLKAHEIDLIVLAGYMKLIPARLTQAFDRKILNIHPALLPKFGGKGMYGMNVHEAVVSAGEAESGISIHLVNEKYDEGDVLFQAFYQLKEDETADSLAAEVLKLEHYHYPRQIEEYIFDHLEPGVSN
jgi:phosphoribosylglycinamide formyltransferase-1